jgi:hypothetical protein
MGIILNLLPNTGGDTPFWVVALVILMTSPPPSPLNIRNHTSRKLLFLFVFATLRRGVWATPSVQDTEILSKVAALILMFWMRAGARTEVEPGEAPLPSLDNRQYFRLHKPTLPRTPHHSMNIRVGISTYSKWCTVIELTALNNPDVLIITET